MNLIETNFKAFLVGMAIGIIIGAISISQAKTHTVEVSNTQKDATTNQQMSYVEKSFNNKGILIHKMIHGQEIDTSMTDLEFSKYQLMDSYL